MRSGHLSAAVETPEAIHSCERPSPLHYLQGRWTVAGSGAGRLLAHYDLNDGWLRLVPEVQLGAAWVKSAGTGAPADGAGAVPRPADAAIDAAGEATYSRALYVTWSVTENCFVRLGPATDASYVVTRCPGWTGSCLVWEGFAYNDHGAAKKAVRTIYEDLGHNAMGIVEQVRGANDFETVASFRLLRELPERALDYFDGTWQIRGYSEDAAGRPCLFDARLTSAPHPDGATLTIEGTLGDQPYQGAFAQGYDPQRGLFFNRSAQSTGAQGVGWSHGWQGDRFDWDVTLAASNEHPERRLHIERRRLGPRCFEISERVHDGNGWRTFGQKTATRVAP